MMLPNRTRAGRRKRSVNGRCSSTSSSVIGLASPPAPYTCRRCWTMRAVSTFGVRARPRKMMKIPRPTASAKIVIISSYLDCDHATNDQVADGDQRPTDKALEHRPEVSGRNEVHESREHDRQESDQRARRSGLSGEGRDLALDADALPDCVRDVVEDLGQVATNRAVDRVSRCHQVEVRAGDALGDVRE